MRRSASDLHEFSILKLSSVKMRMTIKCVITNIEYYGKWRTISVCLSC